MQMFTGILVVKCMLWFPKANYFLKLQYRGNNTPVTEPNLWFRCPENKLLFFHTLTENTLLMCTTFLLLFLIPSPGCSRKTNADGSKRRTQILFFKDRNERRKTESENQKSKKKAEEIKM